LWVRERLRAAWKKIAPAAPLVDAPLHQLRIYASLRAMDGQLTDLWRLSRPELAARYLALLLQ
jgi:hypothetical protein